MYSFTACVRPKLVIISFERISHPLSSIISADRTSHPILSVDNTPFPLVSEAAKLWFQ